MPRPPAPVSAEDTRAAAGYRLEPPRPRVEPSYELAGVPPDRNQEIAVGCDDDRDRSSAEAGVRCTVRRAGLGVIRHRRRKDAGCAVDAPDTPIGGLRDEEVPPRVDREAAVEELETGIRRGPALAANAGRPVAGDGPHGAPGEVHATHAVLETDDRRSVRSEGDRILERHARGAGGHLVGVGLRAVLIEVTRDRRGSARSGVQPTESAATEEHVSRWVDGDGAGAAWNVVRNARREMADGVDPTVDRVAGVRDENVPRGVGTQAGDVVEADVCGRRAVVTWRRASAGDRRDGSVRVDPADHAARRDRDAAVGVDREADGVVEASVDRRSPIAARSRRAVTGYRGNDAR